MNITILGAGVFGTALASVLHENHHQTTFYDPIKFPDISLDQTIATAEAIIIAVPSSAITEIASDINRHHIPTILATKGLLNFDAFGDHPPSVLSGPIFDDMVIAKQQSTVTATSPLASSLFTTPWLHIELTTDTLGVILCGTLKNIYAIGSGLLSAPDGYVQTALAELKTYLSDHGADPATADLSCGIGDLTLCCTDPRSRNFQFGLNFRSDPTPDTTVEGFSTLTSLPDPKNYPIIHAIHNIINYHSSIEELSETLSNYSDLSITSVLNSRAKTPAGGFLPGEESRE